MFPITNSLRALIAVLLATELLLGPAAAQSTTNAAILDLIHRQKYNDAITKLEEILERDPKNAEALTYMATANLYLHLNFTTALEDFKDAFNAGGGATFFVTHSHEKFNTDYVADYCRGWLHLRKDGIEFVPSEGAHGFKLSYRDVEEFKVNRLSKRAFHIKFNQKSQNFYTRSNTEFEPLLIIALHKSFTRN
jgi:tetratricopeptide (TPR) repeat protein